jgi:DNA-binding response OmpR family regulator
MSIGSEAPETNHILVVEDEGDVRDLVAIHLKRAGHKVTAVSSVEEARGAVAARESIASGSKFDIFVLDWMLPGASGVEFLKEIRRKGPRDHTAVLMLTAKGDSKDIVEGLDAGADDYLVKPFDSAVLLARVRALSRRLANQSTLTPDVALDAVAEGGQQKPRFEELRLGGLSLFPETYEVKCGVDPISLTPSEFKLLLALAKSQGRVLTRDSLISQVQGDGVSVVGRTVDTHVFGLRKKLGECADVIETVRGVGYRVKTDLEGN